MKPNERVPSLVTSNGQSEKRFRTNYSSYDCRELNFNRLLEESHYLFCKWDCPRAAVSNSFLRWCTMWGKTACLIVILHESPALNRCFAEPPCLACPHRPRKRAHSVFTCTSGAISENCKATLRNPSSCSKFIPILYSTQKVDEAFPGCSRPNCGVAHMTAAPDNAAAERKGSGSQWHTLDGKLVCVNS